MKRLLSACALMTWLALAAPKPVSIKVYPTQSFAPATIRVTIHLVRSPENRTLVWGCSSVEGLSSESEMSLDGENSVATMEKYLKDVSAGDYECRAGIGRQGLPPVYASPVVFHVIGHN